MRQQLTVLKTENSRELGGEKWRALPTEMITLTHSNAEPNIGLKNLNLNDANRDLMLERDSITNFAVKTIVMRDEPEDEKGTSRGFTFNPDQQNSSYMPTERTPKMHSMNTQTSVLAEKPSKEVDLVY